MGASARMLSASEELNFSPQVVSEWRSLCKKVGVLVKIEHKEDEKSN